AIDGDAEELILVTSAPERADGLLQHLPEFVLSTRNLSEVIVEVFTESLRAPRRPILVVRSLKQRLDVVHDGDPLAKIVRIRLLLGDRGVVVAQPPPVNDLGEDVDGCAADEDLGSALLVLIERPLGESTSNGVPDTTTVNL